MPCGRCTYALAARRAVLSRARSRAAAARARQAGHIVPTPQGEPFNIGRVVRTAGGRRRTVR